MPGVPKMGSENWAVGHWPTPKTLRQGSWVLVSLVRTLVSLDRISNGARLSRVDHFGIQITCVPMKLRPKFIRPHTYCTKRERGSLMERDTGRKKMWCFLLSALNGSRCFMCWEGWINSFAVGTTGKGRGGEILSPTSTPWLLLLSRSLNISHGKLR